MSINDCVLFIVSSLVLFLSVTSHAHAGITTRSVEYRAGQLTMKGFIAYDDATPDPKPGVLVVPEWWGLNDYTRSRARQLAELGYVAFVADMYGDGKVVETPAEASRLAGAFYGDKSLFRSRARAALDVLKADVHVDPSRMAAIGYCFGGSAVQELAYSGADLRGIVSFHGGLRAPAQEDYVGIRARFLICHGADDTFISSDEMKAFEEGMRAAKTDWLLVSYGSSVHAFTNPEADKRGMSGVAYNEKADHRSWRHMQDFFDEIFAE